MVKCISPTGRRKDRKPKNVVHRRERVYGSFTRSLEFPWAIAAERISAALKDGVLTVTLPKAEAAKPRKVAVKYQEK